MNMLAVDDEPLALADLERAIRRAVPGCEPRCFSSPADALTHARDVPPDVAFLDVKMNGVDGLLLASRLKEWNPKTNIIFVTGYSDYAKDAFSLYASGYILKPARPESIVDALENLRFPVALARVRFKCFGSFEIFLDGRPLVCTRSKAKELLAYLVDRRGDGVTAAEICSALWEERGYDRPMQKMVQNVILLLMDFLKKHGIEDIIIRKWNYIAIDTKKVRCDYYDFLDGVPAALKAYDGEYMYNYSWAEFTAARLSEKLLK
ncbi:response regulator [Christensenella intestinihominis]|uniref:response regulator n=1 Tax=Christensenella intestinihominis TaxID=1851429 RepID=UPI000832F6AB|nr:response regulator [Christensenella intestinihominis]